MKMKNLTWVFAAIFIAGSLTSCKKFKTVTFEKTFTNVTMEIPATNVIGTQYVSKSLTGIQQFAKDNKFNVEDIKSIKPTKCVVEIQDYSTAFTPHTFDVLDFVSMTAESPGIPVMLFADIYPAHTGATSMTIPIRDVDVKDFLKADTFNVDGAFQNNDTITHNVPVSATLTFEITAEVKLNMFGK